MLSLDDLRLRPVKEDDLETVLTWRNSEAVRRHMHTDHMISPEEHRKWFQRISADQNCECLIAEFRGKPVGVVSITDIKEQDGTCTWGMYIGEDMRNIGIGVLMEVHAIDRMADYHNIRKIWGETLESNERLILMHKRFGFEEEGLFKKHVRRGGKYVDVIRTALFTSRWREIRKDLVETYRLEGKTRGTVS